MNRGGSRYPRRPLDKRYPDKAYSEQVHSQQKQQPRYKRNLSAKFFIVKSLVLYDTIQNKRENKTAAVKCTKLTKSTF